MAALPSGLKEKEEEYLFCQNYILEWLQHNKYTGGLREEPVRSSMLANHANNNIKLLKKSASETKTHIAKHPSCDNNSVPDLEPGETPEK